MVQAPKQKIRYAGSACASSVFFRLARFFQARTLRGEAQNLSLVPGTTASSRSEDTGSSFINERNISS